MCGKAIRLLAKLFREVCSAAAARSDPEIIYCKESGGWGGGEGGRGSRGGEAEKGHCFPLMIYWEGTTYIFSIIH